jgi:hypothetical protein
MSVTAGVGAAIELKIFKIIGRLGGLPCFGI